MNPPAFWMPGLALASLLLAGCSSPPTPGPEVATGEPPFHTVGDFFAYRVDDHSGGPAWTETFTVEARENVALPSGSHDALRMSDVRAEPSGAQAGAVWVQEGPELLLQMDFGMVFTFGEPCMAYDWPITVGKEWASTCPGRVTYPSSRTGGGPAEGDFTMTFHGEAVGTETATVPAGTFDAVHVRIETEIAFPGPDLPGPGVSSVSHEWLAPEACGNAVKMDYRSSTGARMDKELQEFQCQRFGQSG